jgi:hypothetical protein
MLINPRKRRKRRKMTAKQRQYFGKRRKRSSRSRPAAGFSGMVANPKRRRSRRRTLSAVRKHRRNPIKFSPMQFVQSTLMPSAIGAGGALGLDLLMGFLPLPVAMKTGPMRPVIKLVGAIGIGMLAGMVTNRRTAEQITAGAVTVIVYDTLKGFVQKAMPNLVLGEAEYPALEYISPAQTVEGMGAYPDEMGEIPEYSEVGEYVY